MIQLNEQQVFSIHKILEEKGLSYDPLIEELLDHVCCQVEKEMANGALFSQALQKSLDAFQEDEMKELQTQTLSLLNHKTTIMKRLSFAVLVSLMVITSINLIGQMDPPSTSPLKGEFEISSGFGMRLHPIYKVKKLHKGVDFKAPIGTPVHATADGVVIKALINKEGKGYGQHIIIEHDDHYKTLYAQLSKMEVEAGQKIKKGDKIGEVGSSGASTAPHLHYEVIKEGKCENPEDYFRP